MGPHLANVAWAEAYLHTKWHLDPCSRLVTIDMGRKLGGSSAPFLGRGSLVPSNTKSPEPRPTSIPCGILIHPAIWTQQIMGRKLGAVSLWERGSWFSI